MHIKPFFRTDTLETRVRQCILFPADGSESQIVPMTARTVTVDDIASLKSYSRCVDMSSVFGGGLYSYSTSYSASDNYRKTRVMGYIPPHTNRWALVSGEPEKSCYLLFYNLSPNLPVNLNVAGVIGLTEAYLKFKKRLFWRGDVVALKVRPEGKNIAFRVESLDADICEVGLLEDFLRKQYHEGALERVLGNDELQWHSYISRFCWPTSLLFGAPGLYWGPNAAKKEELFLHDLNELRCAIGRIPLRPHIYMTPYTGSVVTQIYSAVKSAFGPRPQITGPPKLPPELELRIFELCAFECPEICTILVLVAKRVYAWIDPILLETVIMEDFGSVLEKRDRLGQFLFKLTHGKPVGYYAHHIKNLVIFGEFSQTEMVNRILGICAAGVENLVLLVSPRDTWKFDLLDNALAGCHLRRLTIQLDKFFPSGFESEATQPNFHHPCFKNITHLHLYDSAEKWPSYGGWDTLTHLTHLAFKFASPQHTVHLIQTTLQGVQYVAIGHYEDTEVWRYAQAMVDNSGSDEGWSAVQGTSGPGMRFGNVVLMNGIPLDDWGRGVRGQGDFWDVVEWEVERRNERLVAKRREEEEGGE